jgi:heme/copper-type cytochrome/quinol oxidase subunit 2
MPRELTIVLVAALLALALLWSAATVRVRRRGTPAADRDAAETERLGWWIGAAILLFVLGIMMAVLTRYW